MSGWENGSFQGPYGSPEGSCPRWDLKLRTWKHQRLSVAVSNPAGKRTAPGTPGGRGPLKRWGAWGAAGVWHASWSRGRGEAKVVANSHGKDGSYADGERGEG